MLSKTTHFRPAMIFMIVLCAVVFSAIKVSRVALADSERVLPTTVETSTVTREARTWESIWTSGTPNVSNILLARDLTHYGFSERVRRMFSPQMAFTNSTPILIPATQNSIAGIASPYPSTIAVSGMTGNISAVTVTLNNFHHSQQKDVDMLLIGPTGASFVFMSDVGGSNGTAPGTDTFNLTFDDAAASQAPATVLTATGSYKPTDTLTTPTDAFVGAPGGPYNEAAPTGAATFSSVFAGTAPNGNWNLYVVDDTGGDYGACDGGWTLNISTSLSSAPTTTTVSSSLNPALTTDSESFTAHVVKTSDSSDVNVGTVTFVDNSTSTVLASNVALNASGLASTPAVTLAERRHLITATYNADPAFLTSSGTIFQTVDFPTSNPAPGEYCNTNSITIPDPTGGTSGPAVQYPSHINVTGVAGNIAHLVVTLNNVSHTAAQDMDLLLVGPGGQKLVLLSDAGGNTSNVTVNFDDTAATQLAAGGAWGSSGSTISSRPVDYNTGDTFLSPAPSGPYNEPAPAASSTLDGTFGSTNPNGVWSLYIIDDAGADIGTFAGGWCLDITPQPTVSIGNASLTEGDSGSANMTFNVNLSTPSTQTVTVNYATANGTAIAGTDYNNTSGILTFNPGVTTQPINVPILANTIFQANRQFTVVLSSPSNATIATGTGTGTITDNDAPTSIAVSSGNNQSAFTGSNFSSPLVALVRNANNNPVQGVSVVYTAPAAGASSVFSTTTNTITVTSNASGLASTGTFAANGTAGTNYSVSAAAAGGTNPSTNFTLTNITPPVINIGNASLTEGDSGSSNMTFSVTLTLASASTVTVNFATANGTAIAGADYTSTSGPLTFNPGVTTQPITVQILGNTIFQANRQFTVTLSTPSGGGATIGTGTGTGTITDDDAPVSIAISSGNNQSAITGANFASPLVALVRNVNSNPVQGVSVGYTAPAAGASSVFSTTTNTITVTSNASGLASTSIFAANGTAGGPYTITAAATGGTNPSTNFTLTNVPPCQLNQVVINTSDSGAGSLRQAVLDACPNGVITFSVTGTITLTTGEIAINKNLTITGPGANNLAVSGSGASRIFNLSSGTVGISDLTLAGGNVTGSGGAILNSGAALGLTSMVMSGNTASANGGGIAINSGSLAISSSSISGNSATSGDGGGLFVGAAGNSSVTASTFADNHAPAGSGGGIHVSGAFTNTFNLTTITLGGSTPADGNIAGVNGGGLNINPGIGGIVNILGPTNNLIQNNVATGTGGGINVSSGSLTASITTIQQNTSTGNGGGLNIAAGSANVSRSTFAVNSSSADGGGIAVSGGTLTLNNDTISANQAANGGGVAIVGASTNTLTNLTVIANTATTATAGIRQTAGTTSIQNSLVGANAVSDISVTGGAITDLGSNLFQTLSGFVASGSDITGQNPLAAPLGNYGGLNQTVALLPGSPAINAGTGAGADQRGSAVFGGTKDIGAFESQGFTFGTKTGTPQSTTINTAFTNPLTVAVSANSLGEPVNGGRVTFVPPNSGASINPVTPIVSAISGGVASSGIVIANSSFGSYNVALSGSGFTSQPAAFSLTNLNTPPVANNINPPAFNEDTQSVITLSYTDAESDLATACAVSSPTNVTVTTPCSCAAGVCTVGVTGSPVNYNGTASFGYTVTAGGQTSNVAAASLTITPVNDAPTFNLPGNPSAVNEDAGAQTVAGYATNILAGPPNESSQTLVSFNINQTGSTGGLTFSSAPVIDTMTGNLTYTPAANANGTATFDVTLTDSGSNTSPNVNTSAVQSFTITVNSINDAPAGTDNAVTMFEDATYTFAAADFGFTDPNDNPANTLLNVKIAVLPAAGTFKLGAAAVTAGQVIPAASIPTLTFAPAANANGSPFASFTFQVQDNGGTASGGVDLDQSPNTITITVTPVNDEPAGADKAVTILEDGTYTFAAADFGFTDPNDSPANTLSAVKISTLPLAGTIKLNNVAVTAGQFIPAASIPTLTFSPATNASGSPYASFTFQVQDNGGTANTGVDTDQSPNTITINVTPVNDAPSGADKAVTILEDGTYTFAAADFGFTDPNDTPANTLNAVKITTLPLAGTIKLNNVAVTAGQFIPVAGIPTLTFAPAANGNGSPYASFTFQVQDNGGTANTGIDLDQSPNTFTFNVTSVNDEPAGTDKTVTMLEDGTYTFAAADFGFTDPNDNPANTLLNVKIGALPAAGTFKLGAAAVTAGQVIPAASIPTLTFAPAANASGSPYASFTFQVQDNGGTANAGVDLDQSPNTITINVTPVNDAPAGADKAVTILEDGTYTFAPADFGFTDPNDSPANTLSAVKITTLPLAGTLALNNIAVTAGQFIPAAGIPTLTFAPAANAFDSPYSSFTFQVQDNGGTANGGVDLDQSPNTFTVNVTPVADTPSITNAATVHGAQTTSGLVVSRNAADGAEVTHFKITNISNGVLYKNDGTTVIANGTFVTFAEANAGLRFTPSLNFIGTAHFSVQASIGNTDAGLGGAVIVADIVVSKADTTTTITNAAALAAPSGINQGYAVNWTVTVNNPGAGTPTGNVTVSDGTDSCTAAVAAQTCTLVSTTTGQKTLTAKYSGDANFNASTSAGVSHLVIGTITGNIRLQPANTNLAGITVNLTGAGSQTTTTDANGNYSFTNLLPNSTYTATPASGSFGFDPISRTYSNIVANITGADFNAYAGSVPRVMSIPTTFSGAGQTGAANTADAAAAPPVEVPVNVTSLGNEKTFKFTLTYDINALSTPVAACGTSDAGCTITQVNTPGTVAVTVTPAAQLAAGARNIAKVTFQTFNNEPANTKVTIQPGSASATDATGNPLSVTIGSIGFVIFSKGAEGDVWSLVTNSPGSDGKVTAEDTIYEAKLVADRSLIDNATTNGFQRADTADAGSKGNGVFDVADLVQTINYFTGLNGGSQVAVGGPFQPSPTPTPLGRAESKEPGVESRESGVGSREKAERTIKIVNSTADRGGDALISVEIDPKGDEVATSFSLSFDPSKLSLASGSATNATNGGDSSETSIDAIQSNPDITLGSGVPVGTRLIVNTTEAEKGRIGIVVFNPSMIPFAKSADNSARQMLTIRFRVSKDAAAGRTQITFDDTADAATPLSTSDAQAQTLATGYTGGELTINGQTATGVEVSGRVLTPDGSGLRNATVTLTNQSGQTRTAVSSTAGFYRFDSVAANETYTITVSSRKYRFEPRRIQITDNLIGLDLSGQE